MLFPAFLYSSFSFPGLQIPGEDVEGRGLDGAAEQAAQLGFIGECLDFLAQARGHLAEADFQGIDDIVAQREKAAFLAAFAFAVLVD